MLQLSESACKGCCPLLQYALPHANILLKHLMRVLVLKGLGEQVFERVIMISDADEIATNLDRFGYTLKIAKQKPPVFFSHPKSQFREKWLEPNSK